MVDVVGKRCAGRLCAAVASVVNVVGVECVVDGGEVVDANEGCKVEGCPKKCSTEGDVALCIGGWLTGKCDCSIESP